MNRLAYKVGKIVFWITWPYFWVVLNNTERSRLLLFHDGSLLVMKDWFDYRWALPGGGLHAGESPQEALVRETYEELGFKLAASSLKPLFSEKLRDKGISVQLHYFVAEISKQPAIKPRRLEVSEFAWLPPAELNSKTAGQDVLHGLAAYAKKVQ